MLNNQQLLSMETASKPRFTFNSAFELVQSMELEDQNLKELQDPGSRSEQVQHPWKDWSPVKSEQYRTVDKYRLRPGF